MPRKSAEAITGAIFRAGGQPPAPPKTLSNPAAVIWRKVVSAAPADRYGPGAQEMLASFCELSVEADCLRTDLVELRAAADRAEGREVHRLLLANVRAMGGLASKLRLSVASGIKWGDGRNNEAQPIEAAQDRLLGGGAIASGRGGNDSS